MQTKLKRHKLADFSAQFIMGRGGKSLAGDSRPQNTGYKLDLKQETKSVLENSTTGIIEAIKQQKDVELDSSLRHELNKIDNNYKESYEISAFIDYLDMSMTAMKQSRSVDEEIKQKLYAGMGTYVVQQSEKHTMAHNDFLILEKGAYENTRITGQEKSERGLMAGDVLITPMAPSYTNHNFNHSQLIGDLKDFRNLNDVALTSIFQMQLLDDMFDTQ